MPSPTLSPIELWDRWLGRIQGHPDDDDGELAKLGALTLLNQTGALSDSQRKELGSLMARCTRAEAMVMYEEVGRTGAKDRGAVSSVKIHATTLTKAQLEACIGHQSFIAHIGKFRADTVIRLRQPIELVRLAQPVHYLYRVSLGPPRTVLLLSSALLPRVDQKFLECVETTVKSRVLSGEIAAALQAETDRLSTITHQLSEGLVILDKNLSIQTWNRPLQRLTGFSPLDAEHQNYRSVLRRIGSPDWLEKITKEAQRNASRNVFYEQIELQTKQKERRWVNVSGSFLRDDKGGIIQTVILVSDITRHKELENRKNEFISIATHELRTPITAIKGYLTLLQKIAQNLDAKESNYLNRALEANDRLVRLTEDLLQVVRVEENRIPLSLRPVSLETVAERIVADFSEKARSKGLKLELVKPAWPTMVVADQERMEQIFANLIDNAIKYTLKGSVTISFEQSVDRVSQERHVAGVVSDTGIGLSNREAETIFEKFRRTSKARATRESGTGLGLFIVKSFVEIQGGTIKVKSGFRRGSEFVVSFPALEAKILERKNHHAKKRITH